MGTKRLFVAAALGALMLASCGETPNQLYQGYQRTTPGPISSPTPVGAMTPNPGFIYFGAYESPTNTGNAATGAKSFEIQLGLTQRHIAIDSEYQPWLVKIPDLQATADLAAGRMYMLNWNCGTVSMAQIASGQADLLITTLAQMFKTYGHAAMLRFTWDPNMPDWYKGRQTCYDPQTDLPNGIFSPQNYVAAWRHMHAIFLANNVTNVIWVWSFNGNSTSAVDPTPYYPGNDVVDWVGIDSYEAINGGTFESTFDQPYTYAMSLNKPVMVSETGSVIQDQASFFSTAAFKLRSEFPGILAFMYYDGITASSNTPTNYTITAAVPLAVMTTFVKDPYLSATPGPL